VYRKQSLTFAIVQVAMQLAREIWSSVENGQSGSRAVGQPAILRGFAPNLSLVNRSWGFSGFGVYESAIMYAKTPFRSVFWHTLLH